MPPPSDERVRTLQLLNDELQGAIDLALTFGSKIDTKAALVLGLTVTAATYLLGADPEPPWAFVSAGFYLIAFCAGLAGLGLRQYRMLDTTWAIRRYDELRSSDEMYRRFLGALVAAKNQTFLFNRAVDRKKVRAWWISLVALSFAILCSAISLR